MRPHFFLPSESILCRNLLRKGKHNCGSNRPERLEIIKVRVQEKISVTGCQLTRVHRNDISKIIRNRNDPNLLK